MSSKCECKLCMIFVWVKKKSFVCHCHCHCQTQNNGDVNNIVKYISDLFAWDATEKSNIHWTCGILFLNSKTIQSCTHTKWILNNSVVHVNCHAGKICASINWGKNLGLFHVQGLRTLKHRSSLYKNYINKLLSIFIIILLLNLLTL